MQNLDLLNTASNCTKGGSSGSKAGSTTAYSSHVTVRYLPRATKQAERLSVRMCNTKTTKLNYLNSVFLTIESKDPTPNLAVGDKILPPFSANATKTSGVYNPNSLHTL